MGVPSLGQETTTRLVLLGKLHNRPEPLILNLSNRSQDDGCLVGGVVALK